MYDVSNIPLTTCHPYGVLYPRGGIPLPPNKFGGYSSSTSNYFNIFFILSPGVKTPGNI
jgi:hypothetical protein